jgi:thymidylate synthase
MMAITKNRLGSGNAFNIAADTHLIMMAAQFLDLEPGDFVDMLGGMYLHSGHFGPAGYEADVNIGAPVCL